MLLLAKNKFLCDDEWRAHFIIDKHVFLKSHVGGWPGFKGPRVVKFTQLINDHVVFKRRKRKGEDEENCSYMLSIWLQLLNSQQHCGPSLGPAEAERQFLLLSVQLPATAQPPLSTPDGSWYASPSFLSCLAKYVLGWRTRMLTTMWCSPDLAWKQLVMKIIFSFKLVLTWDPELIGEGKPSKS